MADEKDPWEEDSVNPEFEKRYASEDYGPLYTGVRRFNQSLPFVGTYLPKAEAKMHSLLKEYGIEKPSADNSYEKELEYQRFLDKKLSEDNPLSSAAGTGSGILASFFTPGGVLSKGMQKMSLVPRIAAGSALAGGESFLDDPEFYKGKALTDEENLKSRIEQGKTAAVLNAGLGTLGEGAQRMFGGKEKAKELFWNALSPTTGETKKLNRNVRGGVNKAGGYLDDEGIFSGFMPGKKKILERLTVAEKKYSSKLRSTEDKLQKEMNRLSVEGNATKAGIDREKISDIIFNKMIKKIDPDDPSELDKLRKKLDQFSEGEPLTVESALRRRKVAQSKSAHTDTNVTHLDKTFNETKARAINEAVDDTIKRLLGPSTAKKYKIDREKLSSFISSKKAVTGGLASDQSSKSNLESLFKGAIFGTRSKGTAAKALQADFVGQNLPMALTGINKNLSMQSEEEKDPWEE